jgi:hypothetical protein
MPTNRNEEIETRGSSKSIIKTISEIDALLEGMRISPTVDSPLREELHNKLYKLLSRVAESWFKQGFKRGHQTCRRKGAKVPQTISIPMRIRAPYLPEGGVSVNLKSTLN